jgi:pyrroline-5-carboxylate reductase
MQPGIVGAGNMAGAIAAGIGTPFLITDGGSGRAAAVAKLHGGEAVSGNATLAERCDAIFLCHKPAQLADVASELAAFDGTIVSALAATGVDVLRERLPEAQIVRIMPNTAVALGEGVVAVSDASDPAALAAVSDLLAKLGDVEAVSEAEMEVATAIGGCAPAFFALFARRLAEAAEARGMERGQALRIVGNTLAGTGLLARDRQFDMEAIASEVASPGGLTERALACFDERGLAELVDAAVDAALGGSSQ